MKQNSWYRIALNWTPKGKGPMNSVLFVSPFISSIFFSESALKVFLVFKFFKKISVFSKSGRSNQA